MPNKRSVTDTDTSLPITSVFADEILPKWLQNLEALSYPFLIKEAVLSNENKAQRTKKLTKKTQATTQCPNPRLYPATLPPRFNIPCTLASKRKIRFNGTPRPQIL